MPPETSFLSGAPAGAAPAADSPERAAAQADRCRRLARTIGDNATVETLRRMAAEYEAQAGMTEHRR
jgi:hypothetical protein